MQTDGELALYKINADGSRSALWYSYTSGGGNYFTVQSNGGLVVYDKNNNTGWDSGTEGLGVGPYTLTIYDFYIQLSDSKGVNIWNNNAGILYNNIYTNAPSSIKSSEYLFSNQYLLSPSKNTLLLMQYNGELALYKINADGSGSALWYSYTSGEGNYFAVQSNGGLVVYGKNNNTGWDSGTEGLGVGPYTLTVYDYYIQLSDSKGVNIWNNNAGILYNNIYTNAPSSIKSSEYLFSNQYLLSPSKNTLLLMQYNGELALYKINADGSGSALWYSYTSGEGNYFAVQSNGGLVVYDKNNNTGWDSGTEGLGVGPYTLTVYDFYIQLSDSKGVNIWNNNAGILYNNIYTNAPSGIKSSGYLFSNQYLLSPSKNTLLLMQYNGELALYKINADGSGSALWYSYTSGEGNYFAVQSNGGLVVYDKNNNTGWDSGTEGLLMGPYTLTVYDFYIQLSDSKGVNIWNNNAGILYNNIYTNAPSSIKSPGYLFSNQYLLSPSKNTLLLMQYNGELALYKINADGSGSALWYSYTSGEGNYFAVQSNGGLVVYDKNNNTGWDSGTEGLGVGPYTLTVYDYYIQLRDSKNAILFTAP